MGKKEIDEEAIALRKEKDRARMAAYYAANREKINADQKASRAAKKAKAEATHE